MVRGSDILFFFGFVLAIALISAGYYVLSGKAMECCEDDGAATRLSELYNQSLILAEQNYVLSTRLESMAIELYQLRQGLNITSAAPSPVTRIERKDVQVFDDRILLYVDGAFPVEFSPTGSMSPFINQNMLALETRPGNESELQVGDIIGFESQYFNTTIVHRIVEIGTDESGWYAITRGDANPENDPGKVRFADIRGVIVGLIY